MEIVIADDEPKVRFALKVLLERRPDVEKIVEVSNTDELLNILQGSQPDLALLDGEIPGFYSQGTMQTLRKASPQTIFIVLSGRPELRQDIIKQGADAFVSKTDSPRSLIAAIDQCCGRTRG